LEKNAKKTKRMGVSVRKEVIILVILALITAISAQVPRETGNLLINEINFNSSIEIGPEENFEFIELHNQGDLAIDLSDYDIVGSVSFSFAQATILPAGEYLVIARNPEALMQTYNLNNVTGPFVGELGNESGTVTLQNSEREVIDEVEYLGDWYFAAEYGYASLELRNPSLDNSLEESWCGSFGSYYDPQLEHLGGTPGVMNLHYYTIYDVQDTVNNHSDKEHEIVECTGIVTARFFGDNVQRYVIQVPSFLMDTYKYSGIFVYANEWLDFQEGDIITVTGLVTENSEGNSDTVLDPWNIELQSSGNEIPDPVYINMINADAYTEDWEGVLITTSGNCSSYNPVTSYWFLSDGLRSCTVAGNSDQHYSVIEGAIVEDNDYTVRGIIQGYEIWMRSADDYNEGLYTLPGVLTGTVTSADTALPIEGAEITAALSDLRTEYSATTNADGIYVMEIPLGLYHVTCDAIGYVETEYEIVIIEEEETDVLDFVLEVGNMPPVLNFPGIFSFNEDESLIIDINDYASDPDNDPLTVWVEGNQSIQVQEAGSILTISAPVNWNGLETVTIFVNDGSERNVVSEIQDIEVMPINDAPWLELPEQLTINIATQTMPFVFDIAPYCGDIDGDYLSADAIFEQELDVMIYGLTFEITPINGFTGASNLTITVFDDELQATDMIVINVIDQPGVGAAELIFDITNLEAGPINFGVNWMFDVDNTPFIEAQDINSNYAYQAFNWNADGHGNGSCDSNGSGEITEQICVNENLPNVASTSDLDLYIDGFALTLYEHINTENSGQPWDTMGEAGDHRQYTGGHGTIRHNGNIVLTVESVLYDITTYYPAPIGSGGVAGYGTVEGEGYIDAANSDPQWVNYFDQDGSGLIYFSCESMSPVLQMCYGTYNVNDLLIYGTESDNIAPELTLIEAVELPEDSNVSIDVAEYAFDADGDPLEVDVTGNYMIDVAINGLLVTFTPNADYNGTETVTITISDGLATASQQVDIIVTPLNDAPWIDLPDELIINLAIDPIPYSYDISGYYGDVDGDQLTITVDGYEHLTVIIDGDILSITPDQGFADYDNLTVTVTDPQNLATYDSMTIGVIDETGTPEIVFDVTGLQAGPINFGVDWMFDNDNTPFIEAQDINSNYAYQAFNWNADGHGNGFCDSGGSGVITDQICVNESLPFVANPSDLDLYIDDFALTLFEHINTENSGQPWDTMGEAGDHRQYTGGHGTIRHNGDIVLTVENVLYDITTYYPAPLGSGGDTGYGTVEGEGYIDAANSDPQWVSYFDQNGSGLIYFSCGSMSPVLQMCYGTYDVDDLVIYGTEQQNQSPVIYLPNQFTFDEDDTMVIAVDDYAIDPDEDPLTVTVLDNDMINAQVIGMNVILSATDNWNGSEFITIMVDDGANRAVASDDTEIIVNPINDAPWIDLPDDITIDPNIDPIPFSFDVSNYCGDVDDDELTMTVVNSNEVTVTIDGLTLIIDPVYFDSQALVTITVSDPQSLIDIDNFNVNIGNYTTAISGQVYEDESRPPISDVEITLTDDVDWRTSRQSRNRLTYTTYTDEYGAYYMEVEPGTYNLTATHPDYETVSVANLLIEENTTLQYFFGMVPVGAGYVTWGLYINGCVYGDGIVNLNFADLENLNSGCSTDDIGYGDFTDMTATVYAGQELDVSIRSGFSNNFARIWVDFNQDFSFSEDEMIMDTAEINHYNTTVVPIVIPEAAVPGEYRMRVRAVYSQQIFGAEELHDYGEVEDYTMIVTDEIPPELTLDLPAEAYAMIEDDSAEFDLTPYITGENYTISAVGSENIFVSLDGLLATLTPAENFFGLDEVVFTLSDEVSRTSISDTLLVEVAAVNDVPYIDLPTQFSFYTYGPKVRDISAYYGDIDGDLLSFTVTGNDSIGVEIIGSMIHLVIEDGWTGTDTWTITVDDGVSRAAAYDIVNIQVGDALILNLDDVLPVETGGSGCMDWEEDGAYLSVLPIAGEGWECNGTNDPSWYYYPGEVTMYPGRLYVDLSYFDLHWFQVDVTLTDYCDIGCTEVVGTMGQDTYMTNSNSVSYEETHVTIVNGMGMDLDGFYINTLEGIVHEIHVYFADQNPTYIGGHITDADTELPLPAVDVTVSDIYDSTMVYTTGTGPNGNYYVEVEPSTYDISFDCAGYESVYYENVTLADGDFVDYSFAMTPQITPIVINKSFTSGWNWFSINVSADDMSINTVLTSIGDQCSSIKSQTQSALYYDDMGWYGSLQELDNLSFYKTQATGPVEFEFSGLPVDTYENSYDLLTGWNWISYAPQQSEEIDYALGSLMNGVSIKSQTQSAIYYDDMGWYGSLTELQPLNGYMLNMNDSEQFIYPEPVGEIRSAIPETQFACDDADWKLNHREYEYNGIIITEVKTDQQFDPSDYVLGVFYGDECRGIASEESGSVLDYTEPFGKTYHSLMVYSNNVDGESLTFKLYNTKTGDITELDNTLNFMADMVIGNWDEPLQITSPQNDDEEIAASQLLSCYPNPFNPIGTIFFDLAENAQVNISVYNVRGQKIATLINEYQTAGEHNITWNGSDQSGNTAASGLYFVKMNTGKYQGMSKIILLK
jgi:GEVED domain/Lamin Tail Domain/Carboxypeptidase regulatory-like domain/Bacterial Ig domain/FlgD Ig-like domain